MYLYGSIGGNDMNRREFASFFERRKEIVLLDGGMGTLLSERGWSPPSLPEEMNIHSPDSVAAVHLSYLEAGAEIIETNTFGGSPLKLSARGLGNRAREINAAAARIARKAAGGKALVAGSVGPLGELLSPFGSFSFNEARRAFRTQIEGLLEGGSDFILIETMLDLREAKAAVLAAKDAAEDCAFVISFTFDRLGCTVTGTPPEVAARWAALSGAAGVGANCGVGPGSYVPTVETLSSHAGIPVFVYANAGLPGDGDYISPEEFASSGKRLAQAGASVVGGCCGTTPFHVAALQRALNGFRRKEAIPVRGTPLSSRSRLVLAGEGHPFLVIGERINVSRKSPLREEISRMEWTTLREEARLQTRSGASVLDINVGLPTIDQEAAMAAAASAAEQSSDLPLSLDSDSRQVLEAGLFACTGIPLLNSFTAREDSLFPGLEMARRHGACAAVLPIDENGLPESPSERIGVIKKILSAADRLGFPREGLIIDGLTMTVGADSTAPAVTLEALAFLQSLGITSLLGVSNVSHGMPARSLLNRTFLSMAVANGLSSAIMNPLDPSMMETLAAAELLAGRDPGGTRFIAAAQGFDRTENTAAAQIPFLAGKRETQEENEGIPEGPFHDLGEAILHGDSHLAEKSARMMLENGIIPLSLVNEGVVPALEAVGKKYDCGKYFLPQLIASAEAARKVCGQAMELIAAGGGEPKGRILLATVEGDLHDLGKNVVGTILKSHGYSVKDLGKDVSCRKLLAEAEAGKYDLIGLSALMTSTMKTMAGTVAEIRHRLPDVFVLVGGASVSEEFARSIGAHGFAPDAVSTVRLVESLLGPKRR